MSRLKWEDTFSINNVDIDSQHKRWFEIFNDMYTEIQEGDIYAFDKLAASTLKSMLSFVRFHFAYEEEYMIKTGYPDIVKHIKQHKEFDSKLYRLTQETDEERANLEFDVLVSIKDWIMNHVLIEDSKIGKYVEARKLLDANSPSKKRDPFIG